MSAAVCGVKLSGAMLEGCSDDLLVELVKTAVVEAVLDASAGAVERRGNAPDDFEMSNRGRDSGADLSATWTADVEEGDRRRFLSVSSDTAETASGDECGVNVEMHRVSSVLFTV